MAAIPLQIVVDCTLDIANLRSCLIQVAHYMGSLLEAIKMVVVRIMAAIVVNHILIIVDKDLDQDIQLVHFIGNTS